MWGSLAAAEVLQLYSPGALKPPLVVAAAAVSVVELGILFVVIVLVAEAVGILRPNHIPAIYLEFAVAVVVVAAAGQMPPEEGAGPGPGPGLGAEIAPGVEEVFVAVAHGLTERQNTWLLGEGLAELLVAVPRKLPLLRLVQPQPFVEPYSVDYSDHLFVE